MAAKKVNLFRQETSRGFSLLELVIVLAVVAVLLTIAVPSYRQYVQRTERAEAIRLLLQVSDCQERIRAKTGSYDTTQCLDGPGSKAYKLVLEPAGSAASNGFEVIAEPVIRAGDPCGALGLDHTGGRSIGNEEGSLSACWGGR